jgi:alpha(1,3/1,4) fucosyltransferase
MICDPFCGLAAGEASTGGNDFHVLSSFLMKPRIRLGFSDFWPKFDVRNNYFTRLLGEHYELELLDLKDKPDFLIYSCFGYQYRRHDGYRIFYTGENWHADFTECDYALTFDFSNHPDQVRLPLWFMRCQRYPLLDKRNFDPRPALAQKTKFCNFVFTNKYCAMRNRFFRKLSKYKQVDAAGKLFNNIGHSIGTNVVDKMNFIRPHKFTIAFENESYPGYTTEKLYEPLLVHSLPIYWGNPRVGVDFNTASFLNYHDYGDLDALVKRVIEVDQNDELYCQYLRQPCHPELKTDESLDTEKVLALFARIFSFEKTPVAKQTNTARYFIIDPAVRTSNSIRQKSKRFVRKLRYHLDRVRAA